MPDLSVSADGHELRRLQQGLVATGLVAGAKATLAVRHYTLIVEARAKFNASGRPGPNVDTGAYRASIESTLISIGTEPTGIVGTNAPQGRRLELGFDGTDSIGRTFHQPPYPHFGPALDSVEQPFQLAIAMIGFDPLPGL